MEGLQKQLEGGVSEITPPRIVLGITGSIAAYKAAELARLLVQRGCEVRCVMTESALRFLGAETLTALTGHEVVTDLWERGSRQYGNQVGIEHIALADWADVIVVAPATADVIAKMASGAADTALLAILLASRAKVVVAPAMNVNMLHHPRTQDNIARLKGDGVLVLGTEVGSLACGWVGEGRMLPPESIARIVEREVSGHPLRGRKIVVTAGPTREAIDPVRFISNRSSGKMGVALAAEAYRLGAEVTLIHGPLGIPVPFGVATLPITSALELREALHRSVFSSSMSADCVVMAAAVSDVRPTKTGNRKLKKDEIVESSLALERNVDIIAEMGELRGAAPLPTLVAFAVETGSQEELEAEMRRKLHTKKVDWVIGNLATQAFESDTNQVTMLAATGVVTRFAEAMKSEVARIILGEIFGLAYSREVHARESQ